MNKKLHISIFLVIAFMVFFAINSAVYAHEGEEFEISGDAWMDNYTLVITSAKNIDEAWQAVEEIQNAGGRIAVLIPNTVMLGWIPEEQTKTLIGKSKILSIHKKPISDSSRKGLKAALSKLSKVGFSEEEENAISFFNKVASGDYKLKKSQELAKITASGVKPFMLPDAFEPPPVPKKDLMNNLLANGITEHTLKANGIYLEQKADGSATLSPGNSDYMVGRVVFNAIFVESNGLADKNLYTWTAEDRTTIQNEITAGLSWWSFTAQTTSTFNTPLVFVTIFRYSSSTTTRYEPITRSSAEDYLWINEIMAKFGYSSGDKIARTTAFNLAQRIAFKANWAVVSFIAYNPPPAPTTFTNGYFAYAYLRGPYSQLLFRNNGWAVSQYDIVNAHETGHLFGAPDEYYQAGYGGCTSCGASTNNVINANCEYCNPNSVSCMMRGNSLSLCGYTAGHIGWRNIRNMEVKTYSTSGAAKAFFAAGEPIQPKVSYCIAGPRLGETVHKVRVRFRLDYFTGTLNSSSHVADDTGWTNAGTIAPPATTGVACYVTWWNRTVPTTVKYGTGTLSVQLEVEGIGRGSVSNVSRFYVLDGAGTTASPMGANSGPFTEQISETQ